MWLRTTPGRIIAGQAATTLIGVIVWSLVGGGQGALGAAAGGGFGLFLTLYMAAKVFSRRADADPRGVLNTLYRAEAMKLVLAAVFFSLAAIYLREAWLPLMTTFIGTLAIYWLALLWTRYDPPVGG